MIQDSTAGESLRLIAVRMGGETYGVPVDSVREVARAVDLRSPPELERPYCGEILLRGDAVPVIDLRERLGLGTPAAASRGRIVVARPAGGDRVGLLVDAVAEVRGVPLEALAPVPRYFEAASAFVRGIARLEGGLMVVLDPAGLLPSGPRGEAGAGAREGSA